MASKSEDILTAWASFFVGHALAVRRISEQLEGSAPLSLDEYDILLVISRSPGQRLRFSALADATVFTRSGITRVAKRLEDRGFLKREQCPEDKRGAFARITSDGAKALSETWKHYSRAILEVFGEVYSQGEARQLGDLLEKLVQSLRHDPLVLIGGCET